MALTASTIVPVLAVALPAALLLCPALLGYNKVTSERMGTNPLRKRILAELMRAPGLRRAEIAKRLSVHFTTVTHHVRILEKGTLIEPHRSGRGVRYFLKGGGSDPTSRQRAFLLRRSSIQAFLKGCLGLATFNAAGVARKLSIPRSTAAHQAQLLIAAGILRRDRRALVVAPDAIPVLHEQGIAEGADAGEDLLGGGDAWRSGPETGTVPPAGPPKNAAG